MTDQPQNASAPHGVSEDIKASETRYRRLFESAQDGIIILDGEGFRVTDVNPYMLALLGASRDEFIGKGLSELGLVYWNENSQGLTGQLLRSGYLRFESALLTASGLRREVEVVSNLYEEGDQNVIQCNIRDVTESKSAEEKTHFQAHLLNTVGQAVIATDLAGTVTHWNRLAETMYGWSEGEAIGRDISSLVVPESQRDHAAQIMALLNIGQPWSDEFTVQRRNGSKFQAWVTNAPIYDDAGALVGVVGVSYDISERKRLESAQAQLASIVESSNDAILSINLQGDIMTWNHGAEQLFRRDSSEALGHSLATIFPADQQETVHKTLEGVVRGETIKSMELVGHRKFVEPYDASENQNSRFPSHDTNGTDVSLTISPIFNSEGEPVGASVIARDITEQKQAREASLRNEKLYRAITQNFPDGVFYLLDLEGRFFLAEGRGMDAVGLSTEQMVGKTLEDHLVGTDLYTVLHEAHQKALQGQETTTEIEYRGRCRSIRAVPVRDEQGKISFVLAISQDITDQKQAEAALQQSTGVMRAIWESMTDAFFALDTEWRFTHMNSQAAALLHQNATEIIGKNVWEEFPQAVDLTYYPKLVQAAKDQIPVVFEDFFAPLDMWTEVHAYPSAVGMAVYFRDITDRKRSEQALRASEARFLGIVSNVPGMVYQFVLHPDATFEFTFVSQGSVQLVGLTPEEIRNDSQILLDIIHPDDRENYEKSIAQSIMTMEPWSWEGRGRLYNGEIRWIQGASRPRFLPNGSAVWDGLLIDITDRKAAEEDRDRFFTLSLDMLAIIGKDGYFKRINPAFESTLGFSAAELMSRPFVELAHPDDREATTREITKKNVDNATLNFINRYLCRDGSIKWLSWHAVPFEDLFYVVAHDITRRVESETTLRRLNEELENRVAERTAELESANEGLRVENVERLMTMAALRQVAEAYRAAKDESDAANKAKSEFLSRMSHELRTPLNAILGFGQILQTSGLSTDENEHVNQILYGGWHLLDLINEILDISRVEAGHLELSLEAVGLSEVILESCALVRPLATQRRITLDDSDIMQEHRVVMADRQRLKQVFINLISNGIKYNRMDGLVHIFCETPAPGRIRVGVKDTGPGLRDEDKAKLFTAFERLSASDSEIEGTGLGLVLSRHLMAAMGGSLEVDSVLGEGCTFWLELAETTLPVGSETTATPDLPVHNPLFGGPYTVLSIEDNVRNQRLLSEILGHRPELVHLMATNGQEGLQMAREHHPDLVLLDLNLPDVSGLQILHQLRGSNATADIPVIVVSADATELQIERLLAAGATAYLTKPFSVNNLLSHIERTLRGKKATGSGISLFQPLLALPQPVAIPAPQEKKTADNSLRILVAEDNVVNQKVVSHQLKKLGHEAVVFDNGLSAVEAWRKGGFDLIFMDCQMPEMDGYEATRTIREEESAGQHIPIVALTANAVAGDRDRSLDAGMDDHINKPARQADLASAIKRWVTDLDSQETPGTE